MTMLYPNPCYNEFFFLLKDCTVNWFSYGVAHLFQSLPRLVIEDGADC